MNMRSRRRRSPATERRLQDIALQLAQLARELDKQLDSPLYAMRLGAVARDLARDCNAHDPHATTQPRT
jgi:hypothetical protein